MPMWWLDSREQENRLEQPRAAIPRSISFNSRAADMTWAQRVPGG
jgi:hypothetical protein